MQEAELSMLRAHDLDETGLTKATICSPRRAILQRGQREDRARCSHYA